MTTDEQAGVLTQLGLNEREQAVYLALLEIGMGSAAQIAHNAELERTGVYGVLEALERLGLVGQQLVGKKRYFVAQNPQQLLTLLETRREALKAILPELKGRWRATDVRPRVRYYEGVEGMRTVLDDTLTSKDKELLGILSTEDLFTTVGQRWMDNYTKRRVKQRFHLRVVRSAQKEVGERWPTSAQEHRELRYTPEGMVFSMTMYVYGNKVALLSTRQENFGMIIESDELATHQHHLFEALWQISTPVAEKQ